MFIKSIHRRFFLMKREKKKKLNKKDRFKEVKKAPVPMHAVLIRVLYCWLMKMLSEKLTCIRIIFRSFL